MKFQIISDLHLPSNFKLNPKAPYLVVAGDVSNGIGTNFYKFFHLSSRYYDKIFYVPGNHEYFYKNTTFTQVDEEMRKLLSSFSNVVLLQNTTFKMGNISLFGSTFPSQHLPVQYATAALQLRSFVQERVAHKVIITHYAPLGIPLLSYHPKWHQHHSNKRFYFHGLPIITPHLHPSEKVTWIFGHTHWGCDTIKNGVHFISNPYKNENEKLPFDENKIIDLD